jgi:hypothetical protein
MRKIELEIIALSHSVTQSHSFAVVLGEVGGSRRLPIVIGGFEAQAIAVALDNMKPSRPLTHDLMKTLCDTFEIKLEYIYISKLLDGVFYSNLVCKKGEDLFEAGVEADPNEENAVTSAEEKQIAELTSAPSSSSNYNEMSVADLQVQLKAALDNEDYELAARIRDEMNKRKSNS